MSKTIGLSKSRITAFLQCPKRLWLEVNKPELKDESEATQFNFAAGHRVGEVARAQYPKGVLVAQDDHLGAALDQTRKLMASKTRSTVFEATFVHQSVLVRADLMLPWGKRWHMAEVKSSGKVKPYHLNDLAVQSWVTKESGVPLARATVRHINTGFIYPGGGNYSGLFVDAPAAADMKELVPQVPEWVNSARSTLAGAEPKRDMGAHCDDPFECPFKTYCGKLAGPQPRYPVELLPGKAGKNLASRLREEGILDLRKAPAERFNKELLTRIHGVTVSGQPYRNPQGARKAIAAWAYPRAYLDFETIGFAVPIWKGTKPYQQIPFQWSCHIERKDGTVEHHEFLDLSGADPSRACAEQLVRDLRGCKTIVAYNASFEIGVIKRLAETVPSLRHELETLVPLVRDLLPVVRENYYHRDMHGSYSIKSVLPTLVPTMNYENLGEVQDGGGAQLAYLEATDQATLGSRKESLREFLRGYCQLDSKAMVHLVEALQGCS